MELHTETDRETDGRMDKLTDEQINKQAEAEVVPSSASVNFNFNFKLEAEIALVFKSPTTQPIK